MAFHIDEDIFESAFRNGSGQSARMRFENILLFANSKGKYFLKTRSSHGDSDETLAERQYMIFSISKCIFGTLAAKLVEQGLIQWDTPLYTLFPEMKGNTEKEKILFEDIFLHRTGLTERSMVGSCSWKEVLVARLESSPGTRWRYSTTNFQLIHGILKTLFGKGTSTEEILREWILIPCGMKDTTFHPSNPDRMIDCHYTEQPLGEFMEKEFCGAGLWSTCYDLRNFANSLLSPGKLLREETIVKMTEGDPQVDAGGVFVTVARGWNKQPHWPHQPWSGFFHGGAAGSVLWCDPLNQVVILYMADRFCGNNDDAFAAIGTFYHEQR